jgi:hypothetical protein
LPTFSVRRRCRRERCNLRGWLDRHSGRLCCLSRLRGNCRSACHVTSPDETPPIVISHWVHVEEFILQIVEVVVIKVKSSFESTIGYTSLALQELDDLGENLVEGHK